MAPAAAKKTTAPALTAEEKAQLQKWQQYLNDPKGTYAYYPKEMCGKDFPMLLDPGLVSPFMKAGNNAAEYCEAVRTKLSTMCRNSVDLKNNNKAKITKLVGKISCHPATTEDEASFKFAGNDLQVFLGAKASNIEEKLLAFLDATPE